MFTVMRRPPVLVKHRGCENLPEDRLAINVATWNVWTLHDETDFKLTNLLIEMEHLHIEILVASETHWRNEATEAFQKEQHAMIHSCRQTKCIDKVQL